MQESTQPESEQQCERLAEGLISTASKTLKEREICKHRKGWLSPHLKHLQQDIKKLSKAYKRRSDTFNFKKKNDAIEKYKQEYARVKEEHERKLCEALVVSDPKMWPKLAKIKGMKPTSIIQPLKDSKNIMKYDDGEINRILIQNHLKPGLSTEVDEEREKEIAQEIKEILSTEKTNLSAPAEDYNKDLTDEEVKDAANQTNTNAAPGPDKVLPIFIKNAGTAFMLAMTIAFNSCFTIGLFPRCHKKENRIYFPKESKEDLHAYDSYRSIAINSSIGKIQERILKRRLQIFMDENGLLGPYQYVYRQGRSLIQGLLHYTLYLKCT